MYCRYCGHKLDSNNVCSNPECPSNLEKNNNQDDYCTENENKLHTNTNLDSNYNNQYNYQTTFTNNYLRNSSYSTNTNEFRDENGITTTEMITFVGEKKADYYLEKWTDYQNNENFVSWNWPAFLCGFYWFWYRKMYSVMAIIIVVSISGAIILPDWAARILSLGITIGCGLFANQLYMKHATKRIISIKSLLNKGVNYDVVMRRFRTNGGTTIAPIIVSIVTLVIVLFLIILALILGISTGDASTMPLY